MADTPNTPPITRWKLNVRKQLVEFTCPQCRDELKSPFEEAGSRQSCPSCNMLFVVPGAKEVADHRAKIEAERLPAAKPKPTSPPLSYRAPERQESPLPPKRHADSLGWGNALSIIAGCIMGVGLLGLVLAFAFTGNQAAVISDVIASVFTIFAGCAFGGLAHVVLLLRKILLQLESSGDRNGDKPSA